MYLQVLRVLARTAWPALGLVLVGDFSSESLAQEVKAAAAGQKVRFDVNVTHGDPFDPTNKMNGEGGKVKARRGETVVVQVIGTPVNGFHTYPITKRVNT